MNLGDETLPVMNNKELNYFKAGQSDKIYNNQYSPNPIITKYNDRAKNMSIEGREVAMFRNTYVLPLSLNLIGKKFDKEPKNDSIILAIGVYKVVDCNNATTNDKMLNNKYGYVSPVDKNKQTTFVAVPLVYAGDDLENSINFFNYDKTKPSSDYRPLYNPKWKALLTNYTDMLFLKEEIANREEVMLRNLSFYNSDLQDFEQYNNEMVNDLCEVATESVYNLYKTTVLEENVNKYLNSKGYSPVNEQERENIVSKVADGINFSEFLKDGSMPSRECAKIIADKRLESMNDFDNIFDKN